MKAEILLIAAVSRLLDLHDSRRERGAPTRGIPLQKAELKNASYHLSLGLSILDVFQELEQSEGEWFQPRARIVSKILESSPFAEEIDVDYCIRMLSGSREIRYLSDDFSKELLTMETTPLLERAVGEFDQFRLTENARLLTRVVSMKSGWIYEDMDIEKIVRAIENGHFEDVSRFCKERVSSLLSLGKAITKAEEQSLNDAAAREFIQSYEALKEVMERSLEVIKKAMTLLCTDVISRERFQEWQNSSGRMEISIGNILSDLESVAQVIEKISRRIANFVVNAQANRGAAVGVVAFNEMAEAIVSSPPEIGILCSFFTSVGPWSAPSGYYSPFDFMDSVDFTQYGKQDEDIIKEINLEHMVEASNERLSQFFERNREWILERLRGGPLSFLDLLEKGEFRLEPGETPADFFGAYAVPDEFGNDVIVFIGSRGEKLKFSSDRVIMHGDNPMLFLVEGQP